MNSVFNEIQAIDLTTSIIDKVEVDLPASKSISNRLQIINALSGNKIHIENLSDARDTQIMKQLLQSPGSEKNILDAGTAMRFLTAFYGLGKKEVVLKGTKRMHDRPIKELVSALSKLGANISYIVKQGYPPLRIKPCNNITAVEEIELDSSISSQYISALLMIAPKLPNGLTIKLLGYTASKPYVQMTLSLMEKFGVANEWEGDLIRIKNASYLEGKQTVESDWSAASYWYSLLFIKGRGKLFLRGLHSDSLQGDQKVMDFFRQLGVHTEFQPGGVELTIQDIPLPHKLKIDFTHCPDLAQTMAVACALKGIELVMTGVQSLKIKETDRLEALKNELFKIGARVESNGMEYVVKGCGLSKFSNQVLINTYKDHRMAMAFMPVGVFGPVSFDDYSVVQKSYPGFWNELLKFNGLTMKN